jgi:hypothetical protein
MFPLIKKTVSRLTSTTSALAVAATVLVAPAFLSATDAAAQGAQRGQGQGQGAGQGRGAGGGTVLRGKTDRGTSIETRVFRGKGERVIIILEDDDSDRPAWAQGNRDLNPHAKGGGQPAGAGDKKGDLYGDLVVVVRDLVTGLPVYVTVTRTDDEGNQVEVKELQICLDAACTETVLTVFGEIPEGTVPIEVEFGRASVGRAPDAVIQHALDEVISKLTAADPGSITTEESGRLTFTIDGVAYTIDSPLENLAAYIELMDSLANSTDSDGLVALLGDLATLNTAAALLAGAADKTGDITLDFLYYQNRILDLTNVVSGDDSYYDFVTFTYDRTYSTDYTYILTTDGTTYENRTLDINVYLESINGTLPSDTDLAALFAAASDDALEVIELVHTQIHTEVLPGTTD